jgi:alkylation response protein AidB-like acyl-CoA dehydrogenase
MTPEELGASFAARIGSDHRLRAEYADRADTFEAAVARQRELQRLLWDEGWTRWGWPQHCGGNGGTVRHRAVIYEQLASAGIAVPEPYQILEVAGSAVIRYAPDIAPERIPKAVSGEEVWSLGFSEPDSGSDLASLRTRLSPGEHPGEYVVSGHKTWNGFAQLSDYSFTLCRTGDPARQHASEQARQHASEQARQHAGLTVALVDLRSRGVTRRPIMALTGRNEYAEVFFDRVTVPDRYLIGGPGQGWAVITYLMQYERGTYAWPRQARLHRRLDELIASAPEALAGDVQRLGQTYLDLVALRLKCRESLRLLADDDGPGPGPGASVDKLLVVRSEAAVADLARDVLAPDIELTDTEDARLWRYDYIYSRALGVFGGTNEIQRNIIAERLLGLPRDRAG